MVAGALAQLVQLDGHAAKGPVLYTVLPPSVDGSFGFG